VFKRTAKQKESGHRNKRGMRPVAVVDHYPFSEEPNTFRDFWGEVKKGPKIGTKQN